MTLCTFAALALLLSAPREVAITFDDLPNINNDLPVETQEVVIAKLAADLAAEHVPAIGFVNEEKLLGDDDQPDPRRVAMIERWIDMGFDLGNHTFSHPDLDRMPADAFEADIVRGEAITRPLLGARGKTLQWFRHPYLDTGATLAVRNDVDAFLAAHGYRVAPVTIDDSEWIYDQAYDRAQPWQRPLLRRSYIRYMRRRFAWAESMSRLDFGRGIPQILLLHASTLNADVFPRLAAMIRERGYRFITLDEAMLDRAYATREEWTGGGVSWLERWGATRGVAPARFENDPRVPPWVQRLAGARDE